ncbi:MAG: acetate--CoA ligase [Candidatus Methanospirareceae archaeon]
MGVNVGGRLRESGKQWVTEEKEEATEEDGGESRRVYWPTAEMKEKAYFSDERIYEEASRDPEGFWAEQGRALIDWFEVWEGRKEGKEGKEGEEGVEEGKEGEERKEGKEGEKVEEGKVVELNPPYFKWFVGGKTNLSYNCLDRHLEERRNEAAILWVPEPENEPQRVLTYLDLYREVNKFANVLKGLGVKKGSPVTVWMPMIPETAVVALACQRIGALHSIVYTAFAPHAVRERMEDAGSKILVTADGFYRRGKKIELKNRIDEGAVLEKVGAECCVVVRRLNREGREGKGEDSGEGEGVGEGEGEVAMKEGRDYFYDELMKNTPFSYCDPETLTSDDISFLLYTSGTTGKPKAVMHSCGAYSVGVALTMKLVFDLHPTDLFWTTADIGWITGHSYALYGPLLAGATTLWYEGAPDYPNPSRWWKIIEENAVTVFYTAPTAVRALRAAGEKWVAGRDFSSLRLLASVGEPIDPDTWRWFFEKIGERRCPLVDTYWQTETGGILLSSLPGVGPFVPGVAGPALPGVRFDVLDATGEPVKVGESGYLVVKPPYAPSMLRGIYKNPAKYLGEYWSEYGAEIYFAGDGGVKIGREIGGQPLIKITGRIDDVMEVAGHRLGTAEVEEAVSSLEEVAEVAVVGKPNAIKGEVPALFVVLKDKKEKAEMDRKIVKAVREKVGPVATPEVAYYVSDLPKTESGKIIRRFLKGLVRNEALGDMTTAQNPECLKELAKATEYRGPQKIPGYKV